MDSPQLAGRFVLWRRARYANSDSVPRTIDIVRRVADGRGPRTELEREGRLYARSGDGASLDVLGEGVLVFGGGSLVRGFSTDLERGLGLPVKLAEEPLTCVAEGAARALRNRPLLAAYGRN